MAAIANAIDFFVGECLSSPKKGSALASNPMNQAGVKPLVLAFYALGFVFILKTKDYCDQPDVDLFSFVFFIGSTLQLLGFLFLTMRVKGTKSVAGISSQSLVMFTVSLFIRVMATSLYEGYLPADRSGDIMIQLVDACSVAVLVHLLFLVHKTHVDTYQSDQDTMPIVPIIAGCLGLACWVHPDLNRSFMMDSMWSFSLNVEVFQMLPQLYLLAKVGGLVDNVTVHYVVMTFLAVICKATFWLWAVAGSTELSDGEGPMTHPTGLLSGGCYVLCAYVVEILVYLDFLYYCVKSWWQGDGARGVSLPRMEV